MTISSFTLRRIVAESLEEHRPDLDRRIAWARVRVALERDSRTAIGALLFVVLAALLLSWRFA